MKIDGLDGLNHISPIGRRPADQKVLDIMQESLGEALFQILPKLNGVYVCGGAVRAAFDDTPVKDVDFYFSSEKVYESFVYFVTEFGSYKEVSRTPNAVTFEYAPKAANILELQKMRPSLPTIQAIHHVYGDLETILGGFDFTMSMVALNKGDLVYDFRAIDHIKNKNLIYTGGKTPISSVIRLLKFTKRGYGISPESLLHLLTDVSKGLSECEESDALRQLHQTSDYDGE